MYMHVHSFLQVSNLGKGQVSGNAHSIHITLHALQFAPSVHDALIGLKCEDRWSLHTGQHM